MTRELTRRETTLLLILAVLVISLGYYKLIFESIQDEISQYWENTTQEQVQVEEALTRVEQMHKMEQAVAEIKASGTEKSIPRYDNSGALLRELNRVLASSSDSSLDFSTGTTQEGYIIMRPLTLSFQTNTYAQAREIIDQLCASDNLNQISDLNIRTGQGKDKNKVATELVITYFEVAP